MIISFTGTQIGMTTEQVSKFIKIIGYLKPERFNFGLCVGADVDAYFAVKAVGKYQPKIIGYPGYSEYRPNDLSKRAKDCRCDELKEPKPFLVRNQDIVNDSDILIATPKEFEEQIRSGTWSTVRKAKAQRLQIIIIFPDGSLKLENVREDYCKILPKL
jgi:hypothetical protein